MQADAPVSPKALPPPKKNAVMRSGGTHSPNAAVLPRRFFFSRTPSDVPSRALLPRALRRTPVLSTRKRPSPSPKPCKPPFPIGDGALPRMPRPLPSPSAPAPPNAAADYLAARPRRRGFFRRQASSAGSFPARMVDAAPFCPILNVPRMTPSAFAPGHPEESASRRTPPRPHQRASALSGRSS